MDTSSSSRPSAGRPRTISPTRRRYRLSERKKHAAREKKVTFERRREKPNARLTYSNKGKEEETNTTRIAHTNHPKRPEDPDAAPPRQLRAVGDRRDQVYVRRRPVRSRDERFQHLSHCSSLVVVLRINVCSKVVLDMFINPALEWM